MATAPSDELQISVAVGDVALASLLTLPPRARGIVVLAHAGDGDRREHDVADVLLPARLGTLVVDLLTPREEAEGRRRGRPPVDVAALADRVVAAIDWLDADAAVGELPPRIVALPVGCFAAGGEAPAALLTAARRPRRVAAVVSHGRRSDLVGEALAQVTAPTLLIVAHDDGEGLRRNRIAQPSLRGETQFMEVPSAGQPVAEPAAREQVAALARDWFTRHLAGDESGRGSA